MKRNPIKSPVSFFTFPTPYRMKTLKHSRFFVLLFALVGITLTSISCENASPTMESATPTPAVDNAKIAKLVKDAVKESTQEEIEAWMKAFKALSFDEVEQFSKLLNEQTIKKTLTDLSKANARHSQSQLDYITAEISKSAAYWSEVNHLSMKKYGVPFNQLEVDKSSPLFTEAGKHYSIDHVAIAAAQGGSVVSNRARIAGCFNFNPSGNIDRVKPGVDINHINSNIVYKSLGNVADCDFEFQYRGFLNCMDAGNPLTSFVLTYFRYTIACRRRTMVGGSTTYILIGNRAAEITFGYNNINVDLGIL